MAAAPRMRVHVPILRVTANPFHVLCLSVEASHAEVEQRVVSLLHDLERGAPEAGTYASPLGPRERTKSLVQWAGKQLSDPDRRLQHEIWYLGAVEGPPAEPRPQAWRAFGWRAP